MAGGLNRCVLQCCVCKALSRDDKVVIGGINLEQLVNTIGISLNGAEYLAGCPVDELYRRPRNHGSSLVSHLTGNSSSHALTKRGARDKCDSKQGESQQPVRPRKLSEGSCSLSRHLELHTNLLEGC